METTLHLELTNVYSLVSQSLKLLSHPLGNEYGERNNLPELLLYSYSIKKNSQNTLQFRRKKISYFKTFILFSELPNVFT